MSELRLTQLAPGQVLPQGQISESNYNRSLRDVYPKLSIVIPLFIVALLTPVYFNFGELRLSPYLVMLIILFMPCIVAVYFHNSGRVNAPDVFLIAFCVYASVSLFHNHGVDYATQPSGIIFIQTMGPYLLARKYIRNAGQLRSTVRIIFVSILVLTPFAIYESLTTQPILLNTIGKVFPVFPNVIMEPRLGLDRAQVTLEHPIFFGVYCATGFALTFYILGYKRPSRLPRALGVIPSTFLSLSTGAIVAVFTQLFMVIWDVTTRNINGRWRILAILVVLTYFIVDALSNRTPFDVFVSYLTLNQGTGYNRILIWKYGTQSVVNNPLFGIGFNEWERPSWMHSSMDNFWLVIAVRHGIPAFLLFLTAVLLICYRVGKLRTRDECLGACQKGLLISLTGMMIAACTVHLWNAIYCLFMFLLGSGEWMIAGEEGASPGARPRTARSGESAVKIAEKNAP